MPNHFKQRSFWFFIPLLLIAVAVVSYLVREVVWAADTDSDGYRDGIEVSQSTDPSSAASQPSSIYRDVELYLTADLADKDGETLEDLADGNDFTLTGGDLGVGLFDEGVIFPGGGVELHAGDVVNTGTDSYTVSLWFKVEAAQDLQVLACKGNRGSSNDGWMMFVYDGHLRIRGNHGQDGEHRLTVSKGGVVAGQWYHAVMVIDQENGKWIGYLDGVSSEDPDGGWAVDDGRTNTFEPGVDFDNTNSLSLGTREDGNFPLKGVLDDVVIARTGWSADNVGFVYHAAGYGLSFDALGDNDKDGLIDAWELTRFGDLTQTAGSDFDGDGLANIWEYENMVDPTNPDVDADGFKDGLEVFAGTGWQDGVDTPDAVYAMLASYHPFDNDTIADDFSYDLVGGYHAALEGENLTAASGILGDSIKMINTGGDERAEFGDVLNSGAASQTISFWFKADTVGSNVQYLATKGNGGSNADGWSFWLNHDGLLVRGNHGVDGSSKLTLRYDGIEAGKWYHVALIINQETGKWEASLNGSHSSQATSHWYVPEGRTDSFTPGVDFDTDSPLLIGLRAGYSYEFRGQIDDFFVARRALEAGELADIHTAGRLGLSFGQMVDADGDFMPDAYETLCGGDLDPEDDLDGDGISNKEEFRLGARADLVDSDGDTISDALELQHGTRLWDAAHFPDPMTLGGIAGYLTHETWRGVAGGTVESLTHSPEFVEVPEIALTVDGAGYKDNGSNYGARVRGTVVAPVEGYYTFWVSGDNNVELWLSTNEKKFAKRKIAEVRDFDWQFARYTDFQQWDKFLAQQSKKVWLEAGQHYHIEVLAKQSRGGGHAWVAWQMPGGSQEPIPTTNIHTFSPDADDADDDYLPDSWEVPNGLSATDNGSIDPREGEFGDYDADGLTNREEYLLGTHPTKADTDGDGADDYTEIHIYGSDPLVADVAAATVVQDVNLATYSAVTTDWFAGNEGSMYAGARRGSISYTLNVTESGVYFLDMIGRAVGDIEAFEELPIIISVDGIEVGRFILRSENGGQGSVKTLTPWLTAGSHEVTILHDNAYARRRLQIDDLKLLKPGGLDGDSDGVADWLEDKLVLKNDVTVCPEESLVSPVCVEGVARYFEQLQITAGGESIPATKGIESGWYTNIDLSVDVATTIDFSFEGGVVTRQKNVVWKEADVLKMGDMTIRKGDSLRLTGREDWGKKFAMNSLDVTIKINQGESVYQFKADTSMPHTFDSAGVHEVWVEVRHDAKRIVENTIQITVLDADFGPEFPVYFHRPRNWEVPNVGQDVFVEADPRMGFVELINPASGGRLFRVDTWNAVTRHLLARTEEGGSIIDRGTVQGYQVASTVDTEDVRIIQTYSNGDQVVQMSIVAPDLPPGGYVRLDIFVAGVTFLDGTTEKILTAADFDLNGIAYIKFNFPEGTTTSVCHRLYLHDAEGNIIGQR